MKLYLLKFKERNLTYWSSDSPIIAADIFIETPTTWESLLFAIMLLSISQAEIKIYHMLASHNVS